MEIFALEMAKSERINKVHGLFLVLLSYSSSIDLSSSNLRNLQINSIEDELNNQKCLEEEEKELNHRLGTMILSDEPDDTEESEDLEVYP